jgi:hypothetical protein
MIRRVDAVIGVAFAWAGGVSLMYGLWHHDTGALMSAAADVIIVLFFLFKGK